MKRIFLYILFLLPAMVIGQSKKATPKNSDTNDGFVITGKIHGVDTGKIYLAEGVLNGRIDSTRIKNGTFSFTGRVNEPTPFAILVFSKGIDFANKPSLLFFVENDVIRIDADIKTLDKGNVTGSLSEKEYHVYKKQIGPFDDQLNKLAFRSSQFAKDDKEKQDS